MRMSSSYRSGRQTGSVHRAEMFKSTQDQKKFLLQRQIQIWITFSEHTVTKTTLVRGIVSCGLMN